MAKNIDLNVRLKGAKKAKKGLGGVDSKMKSLGKSALAAAGGFFAARGIISGIQSVIALEREQTLAVKKLETALGKNSKALQEQASALQQVTTFGDETIIQAQAMLAMFIKDEEQLKKATIATLDLAAAKGMDLVQAADLVGKSVGSSTNALARYGVSAEGAAGSTERLDSIVEGMTRFFGGQATAVVDTMAGSMDQMSNAVGDVGELIGEMLAPAVTDLAKEVKYLAEWWGEWLKNVKDTKPESEAENKRTKELSQEIKVLTSEIEHRLDVLRDEALLRKRAEDQGNRIHQQSALERVEIAKLRIQLKKLNEEREKEIEIEKNKPQTQPPPSPPPPPPLEGFDLFLEKQREIIELKSQESEWLEKIKEQYPELAESMGLVNNKTDGANEGWELFQDNLNQAAAASILTASSITSTSDALGAAEEAAKRAATAFISAEIQKAVSKWIASMLETSGPLAWLTAPLALAGGAAFGSAMGSAIERISFAQGGDFITSGPQAILVGDNPGGRERVQVEPLSSPNISGPKGGITLNISAPLVDDTVIDTIIPAIEKAQRNNLA